MLGGRLCVDAGRRRRCGEKTADVAQQRRIVSSPPFSLCLHFVEKAGLSRAHVSRDRTRTPLEVTFFAFTPSLM